MKGAPFWLPDAARDATEPYLSHGREAKPWIDGRRVISGILPPPGPVVAGRMRPRNTVRPPRSATAVTGGARAHLAAAVRADGRRCPIPPEPCNRCCGPGGRLRGLPGKWRSPPPGAKTAARCDVHSRRTSARPAPSSPPGWPTATPTGHTRPRAARRRQSQSGPGLSASPRPAQWLRSRHTGQYRPRRYVWLGEASRAGRRPDLRGASRPCNEASCRS